MSTERKSAIAPMNIHRDRDAVIVNLFFLSFLFIRLPLVDSLRNENPKKNVPKIVLLQVTYAIHPNCIAV